VIAKITRNICLFLLLERLCVRKKTEEFRLFVMKINAL